MMNFTVHPKIGPYVVVDTSAVAAGWMPPPDVRCFTTPDAMKEMEAFTPVFSVTTEVPSRSSIRRVMETSTRTGDDARLSSTDIGLLALALDIRSPIVTDDFSVQNTASVLGIEVIPASRSIKEVWRWRYRCRGCGRTFDRHHPICPVCGSPIRSYRGRHH